MVQTYDQRQGYKQYDQGQDHKQYNQILGREQYNQEQGQGQGQMGKLLLPILAAVGAGAATFYTMTRQSGQGQNKYHQVYQFEQNFEQDFEQEDHKDQLL
jgi:hypothetical protein